MTLFQVVDVGVERFNKDHQRLLFYITEFNRLVERFGQRKPFEDEWDQIDGLFKRLDKYTKVHFKAEEDLMREYGYPHYDKHCQQHQKLIQSLAELKVHVTKRDADAIAQIKTFLLDWLTNHINHEDAQYSVFFTEKGVEG
ncbi:bacteriohemerythrin [Magnetococcales bacterium HHB-1]